VSQPQPPLDADLAWTISAWFEDQAKTRDEYFRGFSRADVEALTRHLSEAGFTKKQKPVDPLVVAGQAISGAMEILRGYGGKS